jgi:hypothetical protein
VWIYRGQWRNFWQPKWWLALGLSVVFTAPEVLALHLQFDAHPEKLVFGKASVSGIRFFLWDSQFGRFFNSGPIKNQEGTPMYFVHVFLWAFLPWVATFVAAVYAGVRKFSGQNLPERSHFIFLMGSFFVTFALFSATAFQLDYYTVILFPFAVVLCANHLVQWLQRGAKAFVAAQAAMVALTAGLAIGLAAYVADPWLIALVVALALAMLLHGWWQRQDVRPLTVLIYPVWSVCMLYLFLEGMTLVAYLRYSIPYNVDRLLAQDRTTAVLVYRLDPIVAWELGIYRSAPSTGVLSPQQLPQRGAPYILLARESDLAVLQPNLGSTQLLASGQWVDHKTGILTRQLKLAKGIEPLETFSLLKVTPP